MARIKDVTAREILDSRGFPTVECDVILDDGACGRAAVPSGASTGEFEALELRDADPKRYGGKGVLKAVQNAVTAGKKIKGKNAARQEEIDHLLISEDGTPNKASLGANAILAVSMAVARASASSQKHHLFEGLGTGKTLPVPFMNVINGGAHADNKLDIQEFMIVPGNFKTFRDALRAGAETFHALKKLLKGRKLITAVGDEGGFAPNLDSVEQTLDVLCAAIESAGYKPGRDMALALDVAASEWFTPLEAPGESSVAALSSSKSGPPSKTGDRMKLLTGSTGMYVRKKSDGAQLASAQMVELYRNWMSKYPLVSIEDGLAEEDWKGWESMTFALGDKIQLVGDDIFVTNPERLKRGIDSDVANSILIKLNQIGTVTETLQAIAMARKAGYTTMISHRSGETEDTFIADLAVAVDSGMIKTGSASRTDRLAKYNQLLRIEELLGTKARFAGFSAVKNWRG